MTKKDKLVLEVKDGRRISSEETQKVLKMCGFFKKGTSALFNRKITRDPGGGRAVKALSLLEDYWRKKRRKVEQGYDCDTERLEISLCVYNKTKI